MSGRDGYSGRAVSCEPEPDRADSLIYIVKPRLVLHSGSRTVSKQTSSSPDHAPSYQTTLPAKIPSFDDRITAMGKKILAGVRVEGSSIISKQFWSQRFMEWSTQTPSLKRNLFRLVDVLPSLDSSEAISDHVLQYLGDEAEMIPGWAMWGLKNSGFVSRSVMAAAVTLGVRQMAAQFIAGETPAKALSILRKIRRSGFAFTVDLLGEYCVSEKEAESYLKRYLECFSVLGPRVATWPESSSLMPENPGDARATCVSVKLTALYSQVSSLNQKRSVSVLSDRLALLAHQAKTANAQLYVDAEDSANNEIIYKAFKQVFGSAEFRNERLVGCVVQAYSRHAEELVSDLLAFSKERGSPIAIRLVKGAYWDHETTVALQNGWRSPLFTHKCSADAQFEKISRFLLDNHQNLFPAFGSHNVRSLAHACVYAESRGIPSTNFELQMLYGMADPIARAFRHHDYLIRLYVPLGPLLPGMGYLVRRLLENTSNESFLRHTFFDDRDIDALLAAPSMDPEDE